MVTPRRDARQTKARAKARTKAQLVQQNEQLSKQVEQEQQQKQLQKQQHDQQVAQLEAEVRALQEHAQGNMEAQQADDNMSHAAEEIPSDVCITEDDTVEDGLPSGQECCSGGPSIAASVPVPDEPSPPQKRRKTLQHTPVQTPPTDVWRGRYIELMEAQGDKWVYLLKSVARGSRSFGLMFAVMESLGYFKDVDDGIDRSRFETPGKKTVLRRSRAKDSWEWVILQGETLTEVVKKLHCLLAQTLGVKNDGLLDKLRASTHFETHLQGFVEYGSLIATAFHHNITLHYHVPTPSADRAAQWRNPYLEALKKRFMVSRGGQGSDDGQDTTKLAVLL